MKCLRNPQNWGNSDAKVSLGVCYFEGWGTSRDLDAALKWLSESYMESGNETAREYLEKGFKQKNGRWVKRGFFSKVPAPEQLPPEESIQEPSGGCADFCSYYVADKSDDENGRSFCQYLNMEVFTKHKCPFYHDTIGDLASFLKNENQSEE